MRCSCSSDAWRARGIRLIRAETLPRRVSASAAPSQHLRRADPSRRRRQGTIRAWISSPQPGCSRSSSWLSRTASSSPPSSPWSRCAAPGWTSSRRRARRAVIARDLVGHLDRVHRRLPARHHDGVARPGLDRRARARPADRAAACSRWSDASPGPAPTASPSPWRSPRSPGSTSCSASWPPRGSRCSGRKGRRCGSRARSGCSTLLFRWPIGALNAVGNAVLRLFGLQPATGEDMVHSAEELRLFVKASEQAGEVEESEARIAARAFQFADLDAAR